MLAHDLRSTLDLNGLLEPLSQGLAQGTLPGEGTLSAGFICGLMCASCIIGFMLQ